MLSHFLLEDLNEPGEWSLIQKLMCCSSKETGDFLQLDLCRSRTSIVPRGEAVVLLFSNGVSTRLIFLPRLPFDSEQADWLNHLESLRASTAAAPSSCAGIISGGDFPFPEMQKTEVPSLHHQEAARLSQIAL